jgi:multiple sugar transport system permease protein
MIKQRFFKNKNNEYLLFILPLIVFVILTSFYPLYSVLQRSFFHTVGNSQVFVGLENYLSFFKDKAFYVVLKNTFLFTILTVVFHLLVGLVLAYLLHKKIRFRNVYRSIQFLPWLLPPVVVGSLWILIYHELYGLLNLVLQKIHLYQFVTDWLGTPNTSLISVTIANIWAGFPFFTLMLLAAMQNVSDDIFEAARIDGANEWNQFWKITIPMIKPVILTTSLIEFIWTFRFFDLIWIMTKGGPIISSETIPIYVFKTAFQEFDFNKASAIGIIMVLIMVGFSLLYVKNYTKEN